MCIVYCVLLLPELNVTEDGTNGLRTMLRGGRSGLGWLLSTKLCSQQWATLVTCQQTRKSNMLVIWKYVFCICLIWRYDYRFGVDRLGSSLWKPSPFPLDYERWIWGFGVWGVNLLPKMLSDKFSVTMTMFPVWTWCVENVLFMMLLQSNVMITRSDGWSLTEDTQPRNPGPMRITSPIKTIKYSSSPDPGAPSIPWWTDPHLSCQYSHCQSRLGPVTWCYSIIGLLHRLKMFSAFVEPFQFQYF